MARMIVVQWTDATGSGFQPQEPADAPAPRRFWRAAEELRLGDVAQPPGELSHTEGVPIWGLRLANVEDVRYWCFTVQGRGGVFGNAGTCRFGFLPAEETAPADAWRIGVEDVAAGDPRGDADEKVVEAAVRDVLAAVLLERPIIAIDGQPADAVAVIGRVLHALPAKMASRWHWSSCLIGTPDARRQLVAAGPPEEFAAVAPAIARRAERILGRPQPAVNELQSAVREELVNGFSWLVQQAEKQQPIDEDLLDTGYNGMRFLEEVAARHSEFYDVGLALRNPATHSALLKQRERLKTWVTDHAHDAWDAMRVHAGAPVEPALFALLYDEQYSRPAENLLRLPTSAQPVDEGWLSRLAYLADARHGTARLLRKLAQADGIYADRVERQHLRPHWSVLQIEPIKEYMNGNPEFVWAQLRDSGLTQAAGREIEALAQPYEELRKTMPDDVANWLPTSRAADLVMRVWGLPRDTRPGLEKFAFTLLDRAGRRDVANADYWLVSLHDALGRYTGFEAVVPLVLKGGLEALARVHPGVYFTLTVQDLVKTHGLPEGTASAAVKLLPPSAPPPPPVPAPTTQRAFEQPRTGDGGTAAWHGLERGMPGPQQQSPQPVPPGPQQPSTKGPSWGGSAADKRRLAVVGVGVFILIAAVGLWVMTKADNHPPAQQTAQPATQSKSPGPKPGPSGGTQPAESPPVTGNLSTRVARFSPADNGATEQEQLDLLVSFILTGAEQTTGELRSVSIIAYSAKLADAQKAAKRWLDLLRKDPRLQGIEVSGAVGKAAPNVAAVVLDVNFLVELPPRHDTDRGH